MYCLNALSCRCSSRHHLIAKFECSSSAGIRGFAAAAEHPHAWMQQQRQCQTQMQQQPWRTMSEYIVVVQPSSVTHSKMVKNAHRMLLKLLQDETGIGRLQRLCDCSCKLCDWQPTCIHMKDHHSERSSRRRTHSHTARPPQHQGRICIPNPLPLCHPAWRHGGFLDWDPQTLDSRAHVLSRRGRAWNPMIVIP